MKKTLFIVTLIFVVSMMMFGVEDSAKRKAGYKQIEEFMANYYYAYNNYAQDAATVDLMDEYWAPEFLATLHVPEPGVPVFDLTNWKGFMVAVHMEATETLMVNELAIDTKNLTVVSRLTIDFNLRLNGQLVLSMDALAFYNLKVNKENKIQITHLKLYFADPAAAMSMVPAPPGN